MPTLRGRSLGTPAWLLRMVAALAFVTAMHAQAQPTVALPDAHDAIEATGLARVWLDERGTATLEELVGSPERFQRTQADTVFQLSQGRALWMRLTLERGQGAHHQWLLAYTNPLVDRVELWQLDEQSHWHMQAAGDRLANVAWPERGRYPVFRLDLPATQPRDVYLRIHSTVPTSVPIRLLTNATHTQRLQLESLAIGAAFGALLLLVAACLAQSWAYRDRAYGWYGIYTGIATLCLMASTGMAAHLLWPRSASWADAAPGALAFLSAGAAVLFVRRITGLDVRSPALDRASLVAGWAGLPLALAYISLPRQAAVHAVSAYLAATMGLNMAVAWLSWRRGDVVGLWVFVAGLPLALAVVAAVLRFVGLLPFSFVTQYATVVAIVLEVPLLLVALSIRSRDRHGAQIREQALANQDALTGLLAAHLFHDRLAQAITRFKRDGVDAAIVFVDLVNHAQIKAAHGPTVAEQSLLRSVIKLRRVVRDVDSVGRIGEARFGLILEGVTSRAAVSERAARLIAAGLSPLQGQNPDVTLHFHVAALLLRERLVEAGDLPDVLGDLLASMASGTQRPIRFLAPDETQPAFGSLDSDLPDGTAPAG
jgi:diguanylate cyclase (GGDEF)-like protein